MLLVDLVIRSLTDLVTRPLSSVDVAHVDARWGWVSICAMAARVMTGRTASGPSSLSKTSRPCPVRVRTYCRTWLRLTVSGVAKMLGGVVFDFENPTESKQKLMELLKPDPTLPRQTETDKTTPAPKTDKG